MVHSDSRSKDYGLMAAGFLLVSGVVGVILAGFAIAQTVRAAFVLNVDEKGRAPYAASGL